MTRKHLTSHLTLAALLVLGAPLQAQDSELAPVPEPPPIPEQVQSGENLEPDVTIIQRGTDTLYEYRLNGRLRAVKVVPRNTPPYYLVDADGDGVLETRRKELSADFLIPAWVLFSW
jgi:hypothetical protein